MGQTTDLSTYPIEPIELNLQQRVAYSHQAKHYKTNGFVVKDDWLVELPQVGEYKFSFQDFEQFVT